MLGRLLEISVSTEDPLLALESYRALGFRELPVGDVWSHPYAVVSDGRLCIGLHAYPFDSPSLTFVQSDLDHWVEAYRLQQIELAFEKLSAEEFNELGFVDPGGQMITVLESRTFSPPPFEDTDFTHLGQFAGISLACRNRDVSVEFWSRLGRNPDSDVLESAALSLRIDAGNALTCRYTGDVMALARFAAINGVRDLTVSADETEALLKPEGGPLFVVSQA